MKCKNCGYNNIEDALFCKKCGSKLSMQTQGRTASGGESDVSRSKNIKLLAGILIAVIIIAAAVVGMYIYHDRTEEEPDMDYGSAETTDASVEAADPDAIHRYSYILADCGWNEAFDRARQAGGYLAHINTREEFDYIVGQLENQGYHKMQFFIGGRRDPGSDDYYWVDDSDETYGESLNESLGSWFWMSGEPSYTSEGASEEYMNIFYYRGENRWVGNDTTENPVVQVPEFKGKVGYIIEFDD